MFFFYRDNKYKKKNMLYMLFIQMQYKLFRFGFLIKKTHKTGLTPLQVDYATTGILVTNTLYMQLLFTIIARGDKYVFLNC